MSIHSSHYLLQSTRGKNDKERELLRLTGVSVWFFAAQEKTLNSTTVSKPAKTRKLSAFILTGSPTKRNNRYWLLRLLSLKTVLRWKFFYSRLICMSSFISRRCCLNHYLVFIMITQYFTRGGQQPATLLFFCSRTLRCIWPPFMVTHTLCYVCCRILNSKSTWTRRIIMHWIPP